MGAAVRTSERDPEQALLARAWPAARRALARALAEGVPATRLAVVAVERRAALHRFVRGLALVDAAPPAWWAQQMRAFDHGVALVLPLALVRALCVAEAPELCEPLGEALGAGQVWALALTEEGALATAVPLPEARPAATGATIGSGEV